MTSSRVVLDASRRGVGEVDKGGKGEKREKRKGGWVGVGGDRQDTVTSVCVWQSDVILVQIPPPDPVSTLFVWAPDCFFFIGWM